MIYNQLSTAFRRFLIDPDLLRFARGNRQLAAVQFFKVLLLRYLIRLHWGTVAIARRWPRLTRIGSIIKPYAAQPRPYGTKMTRETQRQIYFDHLRHQVERACYRRLIHHQMHDYVCRYLTYSMKVLSSQDWLVYSGFQIIQLRMWFFNIWKTFLLAPRQRKQLDSMPEDRPLGCPVSLGPCLPSKVA